MKRKAILALSFVAVVLAGTFILSGCDEEEKTTTKTETQVEFVNDHCPIMTANEINPANVPEALIRDFKGKKVAFCCGPCPGKWDNLSDEEKTAKLAAVMKK